MKIIKLQVKDLLPKRKKNPKNGTWHTERSYNELLQKNKQLTKQLEVAIRGLKEIDSPTGVASMAYRVLLEINSIDSNGIRRNGRCKMSKEHTDEWAKETNPMAYSDFLFKQNEDLRKENRSLQEQLKEANEIIKGFSKLYEVYPAGNGIIIFNVVKPSSLENYIKKWGVK